MKRRGPAFRAAQLENSMYANERAMDAAQDARIFESTALGRGLEQKFGHAAPARETPRVVMELDELSMVLSRLEQTAIALDQQLEPVKNMARVPPNATSQAVDIGSICPMGQRIRELTMRVNGIQTALATLRDAIEV